MRIDEAVLMWCPNVRIMPVEQEGFISFISNRGQAEDFVENINSRCILEECPAWKKVADEYEYTTTPCEDIQPEGEDWKFNCIDDDGNTEWYRTHECGICSAFK